MISFKAQLESFTSIKSPRKMVNSRIYFLNCFYMEGRNASISRSDTNSLKYSRVNGFIPIIDNCRIIKIIWITRNTRTDYRIMKYAW